MKDLTIVYYSANKLPEHIAQNFRRELVEAVGNMIPIISVTQKPIDLGKNICVGDIGQSYYNLYKQMYIGVQEVKTKYVATVEDDTLYVMEHFKYRPTSDDTISYNESMWFLDRDVFWNRKGTGTFGCIAPTQLLTKVLGQRYEKYPTEPMPRDSQKYKWRDPGQDDKLGFKNQKTERFKTKIPLITLCYWNATHGWPKHRSRTSKVVGSLKYWGSAVELRRKMEERRDR